MIFHLLRGRCRGLQLWVQKFSGDLVVYPSSAIPRRWGAVLPMRPLAPLAVSGFGSAAPGSVAEDRLFSGAPRRGQGPHCPRGQGKALRRRWFSGNPGNRRNGIAFFNSFQLGSAVGSCLSRETHSPWLMEWIDPLEYVGENPARLPLGSKNFLVLGAALGREKLGRR